MTEYVRQKNLNLYFDHVDPEPKIFHIKKDVCWLLKKVCESHSWDSKAAEWVLGVLRKRIRRFEKGYRFVLEEETELTRRARLVLISEAGIVSRFFN